MLSAVRKPRFPGKNFKGARREARNQPAYSLYSLHKKMTVYLSHKAPTSFRTLEGKFSFSLSC